MTRVTCLVRTFFFFNALMTSDRATHAVTKVKMADLSGTELSEGKEADNELRKRQKRPWEEFHRSGKIGVTPELPESLGFYDISAVRREQRELSAGNRRVSPTDVHPPP